jgi:hypothetical protein
MIVTIAITKPSTGNTGNFLTLSGDIKGLFSPGRLNRSIITDKLTNANTTNMLNTETLAISESLPEYRIIVTKVKAVVNIVANHGVFLERCTSASIPGMASSYFAIPKIIRDPEISIMRTVLVVANRARIARTIVPLLPNAFDAASARGAFELDNSFQSTNPTTETATKI